MPRAWAPPRSTAVLESLEPRLLLSADLIPEIGVFASDLPYVGGTVLTVPVTVHNLGPDVAPGSIVRLFASEDDEFDASDPVWDEMVTESIGAGELQRLTMRVPVAAAFGSPTAPGTYSLFAMADATGLVAESNEANNVVPAAAEVTIAWVFEDGTLGVPPRALTLADAAGSLFDFALQGPGRGTVVQGDDGLRVTLEGTDGTTRVQVIAHTPGTRIALTGVVVEGALAELSASAVSLGGALEASGGIATLRLGEATTNASVSAPLVGTLAVDGDFAGALTLGVPGGSGVVLGSANVGGTVDGVWKIFGRAGSIRAAVAADTWFASFQDSVTAITTLGDFGGRVFLPALLQFNVGGDLRDAVVTVGARLGSDGALGGTGAAEDRFLSGNLNRVRISGGILGSVLRVGVDPRNGLFEDGDDAVAATGRIQELLVGGQIDATSRVVAGVLPTSVRVGNVVTPTSEIGQIRATSPDFVAPELTALLANDTGISGIDGVTNAPIVTGRAADLGGVLRLEASFDGLTYTDISSALGADGRFSLSQVLLDDVLGGPMSDGPYTLRVRAVDTAGNVSQVASVGFALDTAPPLAADVQLSATSDTGAAGDFVTAARTVTLVGLTEPLAQVALVGTTLTAQADALGRFRLPDVVLADGANLFQFTATDAAGNVAPSQRTIERTGVVEDDLALAWNQVALDAIARDAMAPPLATRALAMMSLALYDVVSAIEGTPGYLTTRVAPAGASLDAALAQAAHDVLAHLFPAQASIFAIHLDATLAALPPGAARTEGSALGRTVAASVIALRQADGYDTFVDVQDGDGPGQWRATPPTHDVALLPQWAALTPFALDAPDQFRPDAPPSLQSARYAADFNEVKSLGRIDSTARSAEQTEIARFWADGGGTYTPPGHWNAIAQQVARSQGNSVSTNVRLFAQLNVAMADASIGAWDAKYAFDFWRPVTAIRDAEFDGNGATAEDNAWTPLLVTPPFPEYVSGHSTYSGAAAAILGALFGEATEFATTSLGLPGVQRSYSSFAQAAEEAGRSRVYGGIHYQFSNEAGLELGAQIADAVLEAFAVRADTQAPRVLLDATANAAARAASAVDLVTAQSPVIGGTVLDNLSGVATLSASVDGGEPVSVSFDAQGRFAFAPALATDGSADGTHTVAFVATDAQGNTAAPVLFHFILDTVAPDLRASGVTEGGTVSAATRLSGTVDPTGSSVVSLTYRFDDGAPVPIAFGGSDNVFDQALRLTGLEVGDHLLRVTARDAAGNETSVSFAVKLESLTPFRVQSVTPAADASEVGTTFRPQVFFSRAVNAATLTPNNFYATGPDGQKLAATIVAADDGTFAWLFFRDPLPGGARITVHLDGGSIRAAADGAFLDADSNGVSGGAVQWQFTTVSLAPVANTSLTGVVLDPGIDLAPGTRDDVLAGPDGALRTADDQYLTPLAGVKVFILGLEDQAVFTDAQGRFTLSNVPVGNVKIAVDGRTATNAPQGFYFPEMVMDATLEAGRVNTVMGSQGTVQDRTANSDRPEVYLPRLRTDILQAVTAGATTLVGVRAEAAPDLTTAQREQLTIEVQAGSLVGTDGGKLDQAQVGISMVPPELVRDMLPPGVLQHTFDITVQAPGVDRFSTPAPMTFPNVFNAAPGTQLNFLSFDHTTGRLVIEGTATVSADGLTVVTDPGTGITKPGWHGLTPPGGESDPPCDPTIPKTIDVDPVAVKAGLEDRFYKDDDGSFTLSFGNAAQKPDPTKDECEGDNAKATPLVVKIEVDGPAADFLTGLASTQFELAPQQQKNIKVEVKDLLANIKNFEKDILYGSKITITGWKSSEPGTLLIDEQVYVYRWLDASDGSMADLVGPHKDGVLEFADTLVDGLAGVWRSRAVEQKVGSATPTFELASATHFSGLRFPNELLFDPTTVGTGLSTELRIKNPDGDQVGTMTLRGQGTPRIDLSLDRAGLIATLAAIVADAQALGGDVHPGLFTPAEIQHIDTAAEREAFADAVIAGVVDRFSGVSAGIQAGTGANAVRANWITNATLGSFGESSRPAPADGVDNGAQIAAFFGNYTNYSKTVQDFLLSSVVLNQSFNTNIEISVDNHAEWSRSGQPHSITSAQFVNSLILTAAHEAAHTLGAIHSAQVRGWRIDTFEWQEVALAAGVPADTFRLTWLGQTTPALARTASAADVQTALEALSTIGAGNVRVLSPAAETFQIAFQNDLAGPDVPQISAAATGAMTATVTTLSDGASSLTGNFSVPNGMTDIMYGGTLDFAGALRFQAGVTLETLKLGLHIDWTSAEAQKALALIIAHKAAAGAAGWFSGIDGDSASELDLVAGAHLALLDDQGLLVSGALDFGTLRTDADAVERTLRFVSFGTDAVRIDSLALDSASAGFTLVGGPAAPMTLQPGESLDVTIRFDPAVAGAATGRLEIASGDAVGPTSVPLAGRGVSPFADLVLSVSNNNVGGQDRDGGARVIEDFGVITNAGSESLTITAIRLAGGAEAFAVAGLPGVISAATPLVLAPGASFAFDLAFDPGQTGLKRGSLEIVSIDPDTPTVTYGVVGTGTGSLASTLDYGDDFVVLEQVGREQVPPLRAVSDGEGRWSFFLPPQQAVHYAIFDPVSGLIAHGFDETAPSGQRTALTGGMFLASTAPDSDFDGLPDDIEFAIGTAILEADTDGDGLTDFAEIDQGLDPLGGLSVPIGLVASASLPGSALAVDVAGDATGLTAYVATGTHGLAVVDVSRVTSPEVVGSLDLAGDNRDVAVDGGRDLVAVAGGTAGLHVVDVSDPTRPVLVRTVGLGGGANAVAVRDGFAFVAAGDDVTVVDLLTGEPGDTANFGVAVVDLALEGAVLYALDAAGTVHAFDLSEAGLAPLGSQSFAASSGRLFVADGIAYVGAGNGFLGGFSTASFADPSAPVPLSGPDDTSVGGELVRLNGSGLAIAIGTPGGAFGTRVLDVLRPAGPDRTDGFVTRVTLPTVPVDLALAGGFALVAGGSGGLQVVNYLGFDTQGQAPRVTVSTSALDADPATPGMQVQEGGSLTLAAAIADDVQIREVELLVDGNVVRTDVSFPWDLRIEVPTLASGAQRMTVQVRATDTGGNVGVSAPLELDVIPDTFAPVLRSQSLDEGDRVFFLGSVDLRFDEGLDPARLGSGVALTGAGADAAFGTADDLVIGVTPALRGEGRLLSLLPQGVLAAGEYRLRVEGSALADLAGNARAEALTIGFSVRPASSVRAASGTPTIAQAPSANPGQEIGIAVPFDPVNARATFAIANSFQGTVSSVVEAPRRTDPATGIAYFLVPLNAVTGDVTITSSVAGEVFPDGTLPLQIVPVVTGADLSFVSGGNLSLTLDGFGFIEGADTEYRVGSVLLIDGSVSAGPDVADRFDTSFVPNGLARLQVAHSDAAFGPILVRTAGGTSAPFVRRLDAIESTALGGTPADTTLASANPGQAVTLVGTGLTATTDVLLRYVDAVGTVQAVIVQPTTAARDGTRATFVVPDDLNAAFGVQVLGSEAQPVLQIVPTLATANVQGANARLTGLGFVEGAGDYLFGNATVADTAANAGVNVNFSGGVSIADVPQAVHGVGEMRVRTAGGTSASRPLDYLSPGSGGTRLGALRDLAIDPVSGALWVANATAPAQIHRIDPATGESAGFVTTGTAVFGNNNAFSGGMQVLPAPMSLGGTSVPAGSLLLIGGQTTPDRAVAVDLATGALLASQTFASDYAATVGLFDPVSGHLFVASSNRNPDRLYEIDPATGAELAALDLPFDINDGGIALHPETGNFWIGTTQSRDVVEMRPDGTLLRRVNLGVQGIDNPEVTGLAFAADGTLWLSSSLGTVYRVDLDRDYEPAVPAVAAVDAVSEGGTPADRTVASANAGQVIGITGSGFGDATQVLFRTRDAAGVESLEAAVPLAVSPDGTRLQVRVPDLAATGDLRVVNAGSDRNLGYGSTRDAIYRALTVTFTPEAATTVLRFSDGGLQGLADESWGLDNVRVAQGGTEAFADDFEGGADARWSLATTDAVTPGVFSEFSGRFSGAVQTLTLGGLTPGVEATLTFDLYVLDSWEGLSAQGLGPDVFAVSVDGRRVFEEAFSNSTASPQTFRATSAGRLQIVPTVTGILGSPAGATFLLSGSGFMEGASTVTVGGIDFTDSATNLFEFDVSGTRNDVYQVTVSRTLDGPIRVTTDGGFDEIVAPAAGSTAPARLERIDTVAMLGTPADASVASANAGQSITLVGEGFGIATDVVFAAVDDAGVPGTVTVNGFASSGGRTLQVQVPALARTGRVTVVGDTGPGVQLQVVPVLRGLGGAVTPQGTLLVEGTGLVEGELVLQIDGRPLGGFDVETLVDVDNSFFSTDPALVQQLLEITVPAGASRPVLSVSTAGGSALLRLGTSIGTGPDIAPAADVGDTFGTALDAPVPENASATVRSNIGDGLAGTQDVDLYALDLAAGDRVALDWRTPDFLGVVRVFDPTGAEVAEWVLPDEFADSVFVAERTGSYRIGVSGAFNVDYDPVTGVGQAAFATGDYELGLSRTGVGSARLTAIEAVADSGTPARGGVASANVGQGVVLHGAGLTSDEVIVFSAIDGGGTVRAVSVAPAFVSADGTRAEVIVPLNATTGTVRLAGDTAGVVLQVVPTLDDLDVFPGNSLAASTGTALGSGFAEGLTRVDFAGTVVADTGRYNGSDVFSFFPGGREANERLHFSLVDGAPMGPVRVITPGGTSAPLDLALTGIVATADTGTPAEATSASANPGQVIMLTGLGFDSRTEIVFETATSSGTRSTEIARPNFVNASGTALEVVVPENAVSGLVRVLGDRNDLGARLQVVPVVDGVDILFDAGGGQYRVRVTGAGFVEGGGSEYRFGSETVLDVGAFTGPDVGDATGRNGSVDLNMVLAPRVAGPVVVRTDGGTSAAFTTALTEIRSVAFTGTPADPALASANPGQAVTLIGTGLSSTTDVVLTYRDSSGNERAVIENPSAASPDGTSATLVPDAFVNGAFEVFVFGSSTRPVLQIVPTLSEYDVTGGSLRLSGRGFVEGDAIYRLGDADIADTSASTGPSVTATGNVDNSLVSIDEVIHGLGAARVTTAGGTSAPLALEYVSTELGNLRDMAFDRATGELRVITAANPAVVHRVDRASGESLGSFALSAAFGGTVFFGGLQVLDAPMVLGTTTVPAGSLLLFNGQSNPERIVAATPDGSVIASLSLPSALDARAATYDARTGLVYFSTGSATPEIVVLDPVDASEVRRFAAPFASSTDGGLTVHPDTGHLWYGSTASREAVELTTAGVEVGRVDLASQGIDDAEISGLDFDADGNLWVASTQGLVFRAATDVDVEWQAPVLAELTAVAQDGTPANASVASANVGQVVEITGANFGAGTRVSFQTRDQLGATDTVVVAPLAVSSDGTRLQVAVPGAAATGDVSVINTGAGRSLGFGSGADAIYRGLAFEFTAASSAATLAFLDTSLQGVFDESWGLDNVRVTRDGAIVFEDDFEDGADARWREALVDTSARGLFTRFSGRFSNDAQSLALDGLEAGAVYRVSFDLYVLDLWEGDATGSIGPDQLLGTVDGRIVFRESFDNVGNYGQSYGRSAPVRLQVVPSLTAVEGRSLATGDDSYRLRGSGFMEAASTVTIGGRVFTDTDAFDSVANVFGLRNEAYDLVTPLALDGPIRVTTDGGFDEIEAAGEVNAPVRFEGIVATPQRGAAADPGRAAANVGQPIELIGQGFTAGTPVIFSAIDDAGVVGTVTRLGEASDDGRTLVVRVPALARTGAVRVGGDENAAYDLQVVPVLFGAGGTVQAGDVLLLDGNGFDTSSLVVEVDGQPATFEPVRTVSDVSPFFFVGVDEAIEQSRQLLTVVVPAGANEGRVTVRTAGGGSVLQPGVSIGTLPDVTPDGDVGDLVSGALPVVLGTNEQLSIVSTVAVGAAGGSSDDVDLYRLTLLRGEKILAAMDHSGFSVIHLNLFDAEGQRVLGESDYEPTVRTVLEYRAPADGTYYLGVSGWQNRTYDPVTGEGAVLGDSGDYVLNLTRLAEGSTRLERIEAVAEIGTPRLAGVPAANPGAEVRLVGQGLDGNAFVEFTAVHSDGTPYAEFVFPSEVAADGSSLTVRVPDRAVTGRVALSRTDGFESVAWRDDGGLVLQVVPTLTAVRAPLLGGGYEGTVLDLHGTGFQEGAVQVHLGSTEVVDTSRLGGPDVFDEFRDERFVGNAALEVRVPTGAGWGPIRVSTPGGTSASLTGTVSGVVAIADSGTPADPSAASANPGQTITLTGTGLAADAAFVVPTVDSSGQRETVLVGAESVNAEGTEVRLVVPALAVSGIVRMVGDASGAAFRLQVVPVITGGAVTSVGSDGYMTVLLQGAGFVEGADTLYRVGERTLIDAGTGSGPNVNDVFGAIVERNAQVSLRVRMTEGTFGPISVTTDGGTSAPFVTDLTSIESVAVAGTPADPAQASANAGQTVILHGAGLSTDRPVVLRYIDSGGALQYRTVAPTGVSADGTSANLVLPGFVNGAFDVQLVGSASQPRLQIVPVVSSFDITGNSLRLTGGGFVEGAATYRFAQGVVPDTSSSAGPNVLFVSGVENSAVDVAGVVHGLGDVEVVTVGGSATLGLNYVNTGLGLLRDMAVDRATGFLWVVTDSNPGQVHRIDPASGQSVASFSLSAATAGSVNFFGGLQVLDAAISLNGVAVPAGSLLFVQGRSNPDRVIAMGTDGTVIASLALTNYDVTAGVFHLAAGRLYAASSSGAQNNRVVEIDPADGALLSSFATPYDIGHAGLAVDPVSGNLWLGSSASREVVELTREGVEVRRIDLTAQGVDDSELTGLDFDAAGNLWVSSTQGLVFRVRLD